MIFGYNQVDFHEKKPLFMLISRKNIVFLAMMLFSSLEMAAQGEIFRADTLSDAVFSRLTVQFEG